MEGKESKMQEQLREIMKEKRNREKKEVSWGKDEGEMKKERKIREIEKEKKEAG